MADARPDTIPALRARLRSLTDAHAAGTLDTAAYEAARRDAERALADLVLASPDDDAKATPAGPKPSRRLVAAVVVGVAVVAIAGYAWTGSPSLAGLGTPPPAASATSAATPAGGDREVGLAQIAEMVDKLAARLKERPDDVEGWTMLARSYMALNRYADALPAYDRALALKPDDPALLADDADAMAAAAGGRFDAKARALLDRALAIAPTQPKALAMAGTIAFDAGDFGGAVAQWQKIADQLPPGSEFHQQVMANIDEARRRGGLPSSAAGGGGTGSAVSPAGKIANATTGTSAGNVADPATGAAAGREAVTGTVSLDPALAARAAPDDTVFVLARPETGRMPLAVFRATVKDLPLRFRLDDSMAMMPTMKLSDQKRVVVAARVSKSGNAISQPGDLAGEVGPVAPGSSGLSIVIATVTPAK